jgi:hypothetical protein
MKNPWIIVSAVLGAGLVLVLGILLGLNTSSNKSATEIVPTPVVTVIVTKTPTPLATPTPSPTPTPSKTKSANDSSESTSKKSNSKSTMCEAFWKLSATYNQAVTTANQGGPGAAELAQNNWQRDTENLAIKLDSKNEALYTIMKDYVWMMRETNNSLYPTYLYRKWDVWHPKIRNSASAISGQC